MLKVYLSCIRPDLEYAIPAWDPHQQGLINSLEAVQKFAIRVCTKQWSSNYSVLLNAYGVPSLRKRRLILKLSYLYNILNGRYSLPKPSPVETRTTNHFTRSHRHTLIVPRAHTNSYFYSFFCDTPRTWNTLPSHVVESSNADIFKRNLTISLINVSIIFISCLLIIIDNFGYIPVLAYMLFMYPCLWLNYYIQKIKIKKIMHTRKLRILMQYYQDFSITSLANNGIIS